MPRGADRAGSEGLPQLATAFAFKSTDYPQRICLCSDRKKDATKGFDRLQRSAYITAPQRAGGVPLAALLSVSGPWNRGARSRSLTLLVK